MGLNVDPVHDKGKYNPDLSCPTAKKNSTSRELASCIGYIYNLTTNENCVYLIVDSELLLTLSYLVKSTPEDVYVSAISL
jgi:hypothetical protein